MGKAAALINPCVCSSIFYINFTDTEVVASRFDRRLFRSKPKVSSIADKSQCDRRANDYKNYSFASV